MITPESLREQIPAQNQSLHRNERTTAASGPRPSDMMDAIFKQMDEMERTPRSSVTMCHEQGKTAIYVSDDKQYIIEEPPHGSIRRALRSPEARGW